jgi:FkbM family methyltransferase
VTKGLRERIRSHRQARRFQEYGAVVKEIDLGSDGKVEFAKWQHPSETSSDDFDVRHVDFFRRWTSPGDLAIDIGAFTGDTTVPMALAVGREGLTLGLEPNPFVFKILEQNAALNPDRTNIQPLNFAAAETDGPLTFNYSDASFCNGGFLSRIHSREHQRHHPFELEVAGRNFDRYLRQHHADRLPTLSLVKIDAEGHDKEIVRTLKNVLLEQRPFLVTECFIALDDDERQDLYDAFREARYTPHFLGSFSDQPSEQLTAAAMQANHDHYDIFAVPQERPLALT